MIEKDPKVPETNSTKILEENRKKELEPNLSQIEILWRGYIKGTYSRVLRYQETPKHPPEILLQTYTFSEWQNCTSAQQVTIITESYRKLQKLLGTTATLEEEMNAAVSPNDNIKKPAIDRRVINFNLPTEDELAETISSKPKKSYGYKKPEDDCTAS